MSSLFALLIGISIGLSLLSNSRILKIIVMALTGG